MEQHNLKAMTGLEVWNWTESCRFSFPDTGHNWKNLICQLPNGDYAQPVRKSEYLTFVAGLSTYACDDHQVYAKHLAYSAFQAGYKCFFTSFQISTLDIFQGWELYLFEKEFKTTSSDELGCLCPAGSCIGDPYESADYTDVQVIPCLCVDHSYPSFEHTTHRTVGSRTSTTEAESFKTQDPCKFPLDRSESLGLGCNCEAGRKHYMDPISFQWSCICRDSNDQLYDPECEDSGMVTNRTNNSS